MQNFFAANLTYLRENKGLNQAEAALALGLSRSTYANYEVGINEPKLDVIIKIIGLYGVSFEDLTYRDLKKGKAIAAGEGEKIGQKSKLIGKEIGKPTTEKGLIYGEKEGLKLTIAYDPGAANKENNHPIPITDISVAAGGGTFNSEYIERADYFTMPERLLKRSGSYLAVRIKGASMAPTLQDGGFMIIRLLERGEWHRMRDERIFVVVTTDGKSYLKRVKNRLNQGFITIMSDSPDKASYPNENFEEHELQSIWEAEWYFSAKMPNIHNNYYAKLQQLEDTVENLIKAIGPINLKTT